MVSAENEKTDNAMGALFVSISDLSDIFQGNSTRNNPSEDRLASYLMLEWEEFQRHRQEQSD